MRRFSLPGGLSLAAPEPGAGGSSPSDRGYPTDALQKGLLLFDGGRELCGEGVGFGVPVLKRGERAVFAGSATQTTPTDGDGGAVSLTLVYRMDRIERFGGPRRVHPWLAPLDLARERLSFVYRRVPASRRLLTVVSRGARRLLRVTTRFEQTTAVAELAVTYSLLPGAGDEIALEVTADLTGLPRTVTEVVLMNELGALFDRCEQGDGRTERDGGIGAWDLVGGAWARFTQEATGVWFELGSRPDPAVPEVRLFRGREMAHGRLSWAGFGYSLRPGPPAFTYTVRFGRGRPPAPDGRPAGGMTREREAAAS